MGKTSDATDGGTILATDEFKVVRSGGNVRVKVKDMAAQSASAVAITGGALNGTLGASTPAAATVTTLTVSGNQTFTGSNPVINGGDTDGYITLTSNSTAVGSKIRLYGDTHATNANDFLLYADNAIALHYDHSASNFDFQNKNVAIGGALGVAGATTLSARTVVDGGSFGAISSGEGSFYANSTSGFVMYASGDTTNWILGASNGANVISNPSGTTDLKVDAGNVVIGTSGKGIDFSATADAANMTSELFDDYEEGTWSAGIFVGGSDTGVTEDLFACIYTKIGRELFYTGRVRTTTLGGLTGVITIAGLPYNAGASYYGSMKVGYSAGLAITAGQSLTGITTVSNNLIEIHHWSLASGTSALTHTQWSNNGDAIFQGHYYV